MSSSLGRQERPTKNLGAFFKKSPWFFMFGTVFAIYRDVTNKDKHYE